MSRATLENSYWKLLDVTGQPARVADNIAELHPLLHPAAHGALAQPRCAPQIRSVSSPSEPSPSRTFRPR